jgi:zinc and cadmium transporter
VEESKSCSTCEEKKIKPVGYMILFSDGMHNFLDGVAIASAFALNTEIGVITTILVLLHELPQEIGDFGVLINSGFSKSKAL